MTKPASASTGVGQKKTTGLEKRKACDLCHHKRIRCDAGKPKCSHCVVYEAQCTYTPNISKRWKVPKSGTPRSTNKVSRLESRLAQLEAKVLTVGESIVSKDIPERTASSVEDYLLPPLADLLPIIDDYFASCNSATPLFQKARFMDMLQSPGPGNPFHDPVAWAAVNVVIAIALQHRASSKALPGPFGTEKCIADAHSVMSALVTREHDLLGLQVLLGLVVLHKSTPHPRQAAFLLATAVKLAHRLRIHERQSGAHLDPESQLERNRVFWITYALDREISMRTSEPYLLRDSEMDVDMPVSSAEHGMIEIWSDSGGKVEFDLFEAQVHLSRTQGAVYDALYSVRAEASHVTELQRARIQRLSCMLEDWVGAIPTELQLDRVIDASSGCEVRPVLLMHFTYIYCLFRVHRVCSHNAEWIRRLVGYSQAYLAHGSETALGVATAPLPSSWAEIVGTARACMRLFRLVDRSDEALCKSVSCTYVSAMTTLLANSLTLSGHDVLVAVHSDAQLIDEAVEYLKWGAEKSGESILQQLYSASCELSCRARIAGRRLLAAQPMAKTLTPGVAWLEGEAIKSASHSAISLVEAFIGGAPKPLPRRMTLGSG